MKKKKFKELMFLTPSNLGSLLDDYDRAQDAIADSEKTCIVCGDPIDPGEEIEEAFCSEFCAWEQARSMLEEDFDWEFEPKEEE